MKLDLDRYNERIQEASKEIEEAIQAKGKDYGIQHRAGSPSKTASLPKVKTKTKQKDGAINLVAVKVPRVLIYRHKGAGKGMGGTKGSKWVNKYGVAKSTNPNSFGKMNTGNRKEAPFINDVLDSPKGVDNIATIAAEELGDAIVAKMLVK